MSKIKFYKDSAKTQQVYPELDPEDITKFESLEDIENAFPNVSGEDTSVTLNHTVEAPMKLELAPSELEQATTTGKQLFDLINSTWSGTGASNMTRIKNGFEFTNIAGAGMQVAYNTNQNYLSGTYTYSHIASAKYSRIYIRIRKLDDSGWMTNADITLDGFDYNGAYAGWFYVFGAAQNCAKSFVIPECLYWNLGIGYNTGTTPPVTIEYMQLEAGSTATSYEPYTGGYPQPNPDFPSQIHSISGSNPIEVCSKNLFSFPNTDSRTQNGVTAIYNNHTLTYSGLTTNNYMNATATLPLKMDAGTYTLSITNTLDSLLQIRFQYTKNYNDGGVVVSIPTGSTSKTFTLTDNYNYAYLILVFQNGQNVSGATQIQIEKGDTKTNYELYSGRTLPLDLPVENLFDKEVGYTYAYINASGVETADSVNKANVLFNGYIEVESNTNYIFSTSETVQKIAYNEYDSNYTWIARTEKSGAEQQALPLKTTATTKYLRLVFVYASGQQTTAEIINRINFQLEKNSHANAYTPYGTTPLEYCKLGSYSDEFFKNDPEDPNYDSTLELDKWYLKKNIGKTIFDGTETGLIYQDAFHRLIVPHTGQTTNYQLATNSKSNYFKYGNTEHTNGSFNFAPSYMYFKNDSISSLNDWKTWLSTHNIIVYYILNTPQYILLSDTLQHQLDDIYNWVESYPGQTNISQFNNDLPFIISAHAMKDLSVIDKYPTENSEHLVESGGVYEVVNDINERIADIDKIRRDSKNVVYGSETGVKIDLDDAYDTDLVTLEIHKETTQETTSGNQLLDFGNITNSRYSTVTFTNDILTIEYSGTGTYPGVTYPFSNELKQILQQHTGDYLWLQCDNIQANNTNHTEVIRMQGTGIDNANLYYYTAGYTGWQIPETIPDNLSVRMIIYNSENPTQQCSMTLTKPILYIGTSTKPDYEEFTGCAAAPNPDYPMPVNVVEGYRNLLNVDNYELGKWIGDNGVIYSNGYNAMFTDYIEVSPNTRYTISANSSMANFVVAEYDGGKNWVRRTTGTNTKIYSVTTNSSTNFIRISCNKDNATTMTKAIIDSLNIQLNKGSSALPYVSYGDNYIAFSDFGKNLLDTSNKKSLGWNIYGIPNTLQPNTKYKFSIQGTTNYSYGLFTTSGTDSVTTITRLANYTSAGNSVVFTTPADMSNELGLLLGGGSSGAGDENIDAIKPQIELGQIKTAYEPYQGQQIPLNLNNNFLAEKDNYVDKYIIDESTGKHYLYKIWGKVVLSDVTWEQRGYGFYGGKINDALAPSNNNIAIAKIICSCYIPTTANNVYHLTGDIDRGIAIAMDNALIIRDINATTLQDFESGINNQLLYYVLKTPQLIELSTIDIALFDGINHISNSENATMTVEYVKDINIVINKLTNAIIEIGGE